MQNEERMLTWENGLGRRVAQFHQTGRPASSIGFSLTEPKHGWLFFTLDLGEGGCFTCRASSIPNDFLCELVEALAAFLTGQQHVSVGMHGEPDTFVLELRRASDGNTRFELHYKPSFESTRQELVWGGVRRSERRYVKVSINCLKASVGPWTSRNTRVIWGGSFQRRNSHSFMANVESAVKPNPSIERTASSKLEAAAHVER